MCQPRKTATPAASSASGASGTDHIPPGRRQVICCWTGASDSYANRAVSNLNANQTGMTEQLRPWYFDLRLQVTWHCLGTFPEMELDLWLRGTMGHAKLLVVQAAPSLGPRDRSEVRRFVATEQVVPLTDFTRFLDQLQSSRILHEELRIDQGPALEEDWGAHVELSVTADDRSRRTTLNLTHSGVQGPDAHRMRYLFGKLLEMANARSTWTWHLLTSVDGAGL